MLTEGPGDAAGAAAVAPRGAGLLANISNVSPGVNATTNLLSCNKKVWKEERRPKLARGLTTSSEVDLLDARARAVSIVAAAGGIKKAEKNVLAIGPNTSDVLETRKVTTAPLRKMVASAEKNTSSPGSGVVLRCAPKAFPPSASILRTCLWTIFVNLFWHHYHSSECVTGC